MKGLGGLGDMSRLMKHAQGQLRELQKRKQEVEERLKERVVEGSAGGGVVKVLFNGRQEVLDLVIEPSVLEEGDHEFVQEMVLAAIRQGLKKSKEIQQEEESKIAGGLGLPGLGDII